MKKLFLEIDRDDSIQSTETAALFNHILCHMLSAVKIAAISKLTFLLTEEI